MLYMYRTQVLSSQGLLVVISISDKISYHNDGLVQVRRNSSALAMELCLSCTNPLIRNNKVEKLHVLCLESPYRYEISKPSGQRYAGAPVKFQSYVKI